MLTTKILGHGEVGQAIRELGGERSGALHVCIPWGDGFLGSVREAMKNHRGLVLVHSTVPVGTTSQLETAVHCPIRGQHPKLVEGFRTFVAYAGGARAEEAKEVLLGMGAPAVVTTTDSRNTEALKLWDTTYYAWNVVFEKAVWAYCEKHGLDFGLVYEHANTTYKAGYEQLHMPGVGRPILAHVPGRIGGHCLIPNCELLEDELAKFVLRFNESL